MFEQILGHDSIKNYLVSALQSERLPNTLLFSGMEGIGKKKLAYHAASTLLKSPLSRIEGGNHPDFHLLVPEGKSGLHSIDSIRDAIGAVHQAPFEAPAKVFIIDFIERMQSAAANALLKTLEEPSLDSYFFLITSHPQEILPTILSRCTKLTFYPLTQQHIETILHHHNLSPDLAKFSQGSASQAFELAQFPEAESARKVLFSLLFSPFSYPQLTAGLEQIDRLLETEDPLLRQTRIAHLFASIALFFRDQELRRINPKSPLLFFPDLPQRPSCRWEEPLASARLAFERNIKLSTCLETFLLYLKNS